MPLRGNRIEDSVCFVVCGLSAMFVAGWLSVCHTLTKKNYQCTGLHKRRTFIVLVKNYREN